jgi:hypothetical protein
VAAAVGFGGAPPDWAGACAAAGAGGGGAADGCAVTLIVGSIIATHAATTQPAFINQTLLEALMSHLFSIEMLTFV